MANNDSYPTSESELITTNLPGLATKAPKNLDFINDWVDVTVENEIWRGKKLRQEKPLQDKSANEYGIDIDILRSLCPENRRHERRGLRKFHKIKTIPSTPRSTSPYRAPIVYPPINRITRINTPRTKRKTQRKCSMRIAELAVPTKRQCIDTWRNKSYILPEFMVERLKQHVLDQRPIVKIPEAIYCFQRRPQSSKSSKKSPQSHYEINDNLLKPYREMDTRTLCVIFGHKIAKKLLTPMNLTLNSDLQKISRIVAKDIGRMLYKPQCVSNKINFENLKNKSIHMDVSNKITVWIAGILEDLSFKLLEEDLRVKKKKEANAERAEQYVTIMETMLQKEQTTIATDLEEEEGPVLDFIDDVVDNVMEICEPPPRFFDEDTDTTDSSKDRLIGEESEKPLTPSESSEKHMTKLDQIFDTEEATDDGQNFTEDTDDLIDTDDILTDTEYFRNEIFNMIDKVNKESGEDIDIGSEDELEKDMSSQIAMDNEEHADKTNYDTDKDEINDDSNDIKVKEEAFDNSETNNLNVSDVFELLSEDSGDDKNSKKVKFSVTDLVNPDNSDEQIKSSTIEEPEGDEQEQSQWHATNDKLKSNIVFAEPNENLLSDSDESWVGDMTERPMLKVSDSASKSVSSLGKILEKDEKQITPIDSESNLNDKQTIGVTKEEEIIVGNQLDYVFFPEKNDIGSQTNKTLLESCKETTTETDTTSMTNIDSTTLDEKYIGNSLIGSETLGKELVKSVKQDKHQMDIRDYNDTTIDVPKTASITGIPKVSEIENTASDKAKSQINYGWKVHPKTAPSWVISWGHERGEPSEDSVSLQMGPTNVTESDMRKWCKDLEKAFTNLEMWSNWIDSTCKQTAFLMKQKETEWPSLRKKGATDWLRLKKNIYKDAILWTKLYQRTEKNFRSLKRKYNNVEIVTAEYCALCTCKNTTRKYKNTPYLCNTK